MPNGATNNFLCCRVWMFYFIFFFSISLSFISITPNFRPEEGWRGGSGGVVCMSGGDEAVKSYMRRYDGTHLRGCEEPIVQFFSSGPRLYEQSPKVFEKIYTKRPQPDGSQLQKCP